MKHNNHSRRIWNLIERYAWMWNLSNWNLFSDTVVNFTINNGKFNGSVSMHEITAVESPQYGRIAVAYQELGKGFPQVSFQRPFEVADFIASLGATVNTTKETVVIGERAPQDSNMPYAATGSKTM